MPKTRQKPVAPWKKSVLANVNTITFAAWQLRQTWSLLLFISLGMVIALVISCTLPLYAEVMLTAGMRSNLQAAPDSSDIQLITGTSGISSGVVQSVRNQFDPLFHHELGNLVHLTQFSLSSTDFSFSPPQRSRSLVVFATSIQQATPYLGPVQGRAPRITQNPIKDLEIMITPETAKSLGIGIGSLLPLALSYGASLLEESANVPLLTTKIYAHIVGLFNVSPANTTFWQGQNFKPLSFGSEGSTPFYQYTVLAADNALLGLYDQLSARQHTNVIFSISKYTLTWHYHLDTTHLTINDLDPLVKRLGNIQTTVDSLYGNLETVTATPSFDFPYLSQVDLAGQILPSAPNGSILENFQGRMAVAFIPVALFATLNLLLILFFVSLMTTILVDRQADTIAVLRSRGASNRQIFGALFLQGSGAGICALCIGPPLAAIVVTLLAQRFLAPGASGAVNLITDHPLQAILSTGWYALAMILVALATLGISLSAAARVNVVTLRQDQTRSQGRPIWQRLNLDILAGVIALVGYVFSFYVTSIGNVLQGDAKTLIGTPLAAFSPLFLLVGCLLLLLRLFPRLLQLGARVAGRGRGLTTMLAFAQMARAPRFSLRTIFLLSLAITFALFSLVFFATETSHIQDLVNEQAGADFGGYGFFPRMSPAQISGQYQNIAGVYAVSTGYVDKGMGGTANVPITFQAVDAGTYGNTANWTSQAAFQAARPLLAQLVSQRSTGSLSIPAIVDTTTLSKLRLQTGSSFKILLNNAYNFNTSYTIIGVVHQIPTINVLGGVGNGNGSVITGGILVDYQTYIHAFQQAIKATRNFSIALPQINYVWLRTSSQPTLLASVRAALKSPQLSLSSLIDRRLLLTTLSADPLYLFLDGVLIIGTGAAVLLAFVGCLLTAWLSVRTRLVHLVTLRALGTTMRQVILILSWEQAIIYISASLLGGSFAALLIFSVIPVITYTDLNVSVSTQQTFALQSALTSQVVVPPMLALSPLLLVILFGTVLTLITSTVRRPTFAQVLRLNED